GTPMLQEKAAVLLAVQAAEVATGPVLAGGLAVEQQRASRPCALGAAAQQLQAEVDVLGAVPVGAVEGTDPRERGARDEQARRRHGRGAQAGTEGLLPRPLPATFVEGFDRAFSPAEANCPMLNACSACRRGVVTGVEQGRPHRLDAV